MIHVENEVTASERFEFGKNWRQFLKVLDEERITDAEKSLKQRLSMETFQGKTFLDIGAGSGLFSLAARRLGARVHSFDYDPVAVECTAELRQRYFPNDPTWTIEQGSVLDITYLQAFGTWDIVYSWGVLHHTGAMWQALENVLELVAPGGYLFISIYNDQGGTSRRWRYIKRAYNRMPEYLRFLILIPLAIWLRGPRMLRDLLMHGNPLLLWQDYHKQRGMSAWRDLVDWAGGYPFEVAKPEEIFDFYHKRGFNLEQLKTCGKGHGCNEYVFWKPIRS